MILFQETVKKWVCMFTCLKLRAVNVELVDGVDSQVCLDAVSDFLQ